MPLPVQIDFAKLREHDDKLYRAVSGSFNVDDGVHEIDLMELVGDTRLRLSEFVRDQRKRDEEPEEFRINPQEAANRKKIADAEAGGARLQQYAEQGLESSEHNATAIRKFLDEHPQINGVVTPGTIDAAVSRLGPKGSNVLRWTPKAEPTPVQPQVIVKLSDGSDQLPLDAPLSYSYTTAQLKDLDARRRARATRDRKGWHGAAL